jgi:hypothetical protein
MDGSGLLPAMFSAVPASDTVAATGGTDAVPLVPSDEAAKRSGHSKEASSARRGLTMLATGAVAAIYGDRVLEVGTREKSQPAPGRIVFEALTQPSRGPTRQWLILLSDEQWPEILHAHEPDTVVWSSLWTGRPDARVRFDLLSGSPDSGTSLRWTLSVDEPAPEAALIRHMCKRLNELINAELRHSFGG